MTTPLVKNYESTVLDGDCGASEAIAIITTNRVDRDGEVVVPEGGRFTNYRSNPIVMYGHAKGLPAEGEVGMPIGTNIWIKPTSDGTGLIARHAFDMEDSFAARVCGKVKRSVLRTYSITFLPLAFGPPTKAEIAKYPHWIDAKRIYREWELIEYSVVAMPSNIDAVNIAKRPKDDDSTVVPPPDEPAGKPYRPTSAFAASKDIEESCTVADKAPVRVTKDRIARKPMDEVVDAEATQAEVLLTSEENTESSLVDDSVTTTEPIEKAVKKDDEGDDEEEMSFKPGDHVKCKAPHFRGHGKVMSVHKDGMVPEVEEDMVGTREEPAMRVKCYKAMGDGHVATKIQKAMLCKHAEKCGELKEPTPKKAAPAPEAVDEGWTEAQKLAYKAAMDFDALVHKKVADRFETTVLGRV